MAYANNGIGSTKPYEAQSTVRERGEREREGEGKSGRDNQGFKWQYRET